MNVRTANASQRLLYGTGLSALKMANLQPMDEGGYLEFFLTGPDKIHFAAYDKPETDKSLTNKILGPVWDRLARMVPETMAPNSLSMIGVLCVCQAWYFDMLYKDKFPATVRRRSACPLFPSNPPLTGP